MDYFILLLICWGSIFVNTSLFTDTQIFPKWLCFFAGILLYGFYIGLKGFPKKKDSKIPILFKYHSHLMYYASIVWDRTIYAWRVDGNEKFHHGEF